VGEKMSSHFNCFFKFQGNLLSLFYYLDNIVENFHQLMLNISWDACHLLHNKKARGKKKTKKKSFEKNLCNCKK
jgi:hypothetical protein